MFRAEVVCIMIGKNEYIMNHWPAQLVSHAKLHASKKNYTGSHIYGLLLLYSKKANRK